MKQGLDIHDYRLRVERAVRVVESAKISDRNKQIIFRFRDFVSLEGMSLARIDRYLGILKQWAELIAVDFDKATKDDVAKAVRVIQDADYSPWTKATYKIMLKRFYKWLKDTDGYPDEVKWVKSNVKRTEKTLPANGDLLTEGDIQKAIGFADHPRDKALLAVLYESGTRIGELATLQIGNVKFDEYGAVLHVQGKTGSRPVRIMSSVPFLVAWLGSHPFRDDEKAPLWVNHNGSYMKYVGIRVMLQRLFIKAGISKRFNPHIFRHSRATFLADHLTEFQMNQYFGWIQGSRVPSTYVHMSGKKIDAPILALNGVARPFVNESQLKPRICSRCDTLNAADAKYCMKCVGILDLKTAFEVEKRAADRKTADALLDMLMKDPEFVKIVEERVRGIG